jgi:type I restriction enzyme, S subunit
MSDHLHKSKVPTLRFPGFHGHWKSTSISQQLQKVVKPVDVEIEERYRQIGVRSHGKGLFHKEAVFGSELGEKRVFWVQPNTLVINIVFAWEQALAITTDDEIGMVGSHRFPMFASIKDKSNLKFIFHFFMRKKGKSLLSLASPGGAGRNKTLGQNEFLKLKALLPDYAEQTKIAAFLDSLDKKIEMLMLKKCELSKFKRGISKKLFDQDVRFKNNQVAFPDWVKKTLNDVLIVEMGQSPDSSTYNDQGDGLPLIQGNADIVNRKSAPRRFTSKPTKKCFAGDILISVRAPVGEIAISGHEACIGRGVASARVRANESRDFWYQFLLYYEEKWTRLGQGSTFSSINGSDIRGIEVNSPHINEQKKIGVALGALDSKLEAIVNQIENLIAFKKSMLQKMFA